MFIERMAEGVLTNFAGNVLAQLSSQALQQLGMVIGVEDDLKRLKSNVSAIQAVLADAEERQNKSKLLKDWLKKLGEALYDADDVLDEISTQALRRQVMTRGKHAKQVRIFFSRSNQPTFNYKMSREIKIIRERLDEISAEKDKFGFIETSSTPRMIQHDGLSHQMGTHSAFIEEEVVGREDDKMLVKRLLFDIDDVAGHNVSFIAIVGMGGIGKTTLARLLYHDCEVSKHFDLKMWVWVSDQFDVKRVVEEMIELASGSQPKVKGIEALCVKLQELIGGKKYLLVMDDMWDESEKKWEEFKPLLMCGARGSKILITKRDSIVLAEVRSMTKLISLEGLSDESSWSLFQKVAFKKIGSPKMIQLGKEILGKCGGIPLVIRHIGRLLFSKFSEEEWISFKNDELSRITRENNDLTNILALSYKHLPPHLKQCFAYSSLYSKYEFVDKDELIRQWIAHGFVQSREGSKSMEIANDYFTELCWRFFYEHHDGYVCMHDKMHDLAGMVTHNENIYHFSLGHNMKAWKDFPSELLEAKGLRTLRKSLLNFMDKVDLAKLLSNFPRLRVLDLSNANIYMVPKALKKLKHLRYLDLSNNLGLQSLPNFIGELVNLQTLYLNGCKTLTELPRDIIDLANLRHLELDGRSKLTHMPKEIGKLSCLQTLSLFVLDEKKKGSKLSELKELIDLRGGLYIKGLEHLRGNPYEAKLANLKDKKGLRDLVLQWKVRSKADESKDGLNDESILEGLELHPNVESVCIWRYKGQELPNWVSNPISKLTHISLGKCNRLQRLPQFHQLPALKKLHLEELTSLQFIIDNNNPGSSSSSTFVFFPSLEILILKNMPNLEAWWEGESRVRDGKSKKTGLLPDLKEWMKGVLGDEESEKRRDLLPNFARLTDLSIHDCPKLRWVPRQPSLKKVELNKVGVWMVTSIGPSSNLEYVTLKNIEDLKHIPMDLRRSSSIKKVKVSNCPPFTSVNNSNYSYNERLRKSPDVIEERMRKASRPIIDPEDIDGCCLMEDRSINVRARWFIIEQIQQSPTN